MLNRTAFAAVRAAVWTAAFIKALPAVTQGQEAEIGASYRAWRTLECWLVAWGPTFAPANTRGEPDWLQALAVLHETLPKDQQMFPNLAPAAPTDAKSPRR